MKRSKSKHNNNLTELSKPLFNIFQALYMSFYNSRLYIDVIRRWKGVAFFYLMLLSLILAIPLYILVATRCYHEINNSIVKVIADIPKITIKNGVGVCDKTMPYIIRNAKHEERVYIDTTKKADTAIMYKFPKLMVYFAQDKLLFREGFFATFANKLPEYSSRIYYFDYFKYMNESFSGNDFIKDKKINLIIKILIAAIYPLLVGIVFGLCAFFNFSLSLMAKMVSRTILKTYLKYKEVYRLMLIASTPSLLILDVLLSTQTTVFASGYIVLFIMVAYFSMGVLAYRRDSQQLARVF
ncbi:MAG: hypothetical protein A3F18_01775 [Legionellales bacterium RIFCSPHIGHO2_12_FULL_37_14]|nr:MAG: hypothetical protein A3F18_01775 [Legionellales bacterium RIFCSPHIGHO2_12_FULL_37_14]